MHPGEHAPLMRLFVHYFGTLDKYRGNVHLASWQKFNIEGNRWEVFSYIWQGEINTLDQIYEELKGREMSRDEYAFILFELEQHGWVKNAAGKFIMTEAGQKLRDEVEALTDQYFFAPWSCLNEAELEDLANLAAHLLDGLSGLQGKEANI